MAEFNNITSEQLKCLVWVCGLVDPQDADIQTRVLRKLKENPLTTLKELSVEVQQFMDIRKDSDSSEHHRSPSPCSPHYYEEEKPPSLCYRYGGWHCAKDCDFVSKLCHDCNTVGHKKGYCKNFLSKRGA